MDFWALTNDIVNSKNFIKRCILKTIEVGGRRQKKEEDFGPFVEKGCQSSTVECVGKNRVTR